METFQHTNMEKYIPSIKYYPPLPLIPPFSPSPSPLSLPLPPSSPLPLHTKNRYLLSLLIYFTSHIPSPQFKHTRTLFIPCNSISFFIHAHNTQTKTGTHPTFRFYLAIFSKNRNLIEKKSPLQKRKTDSDWSFEWVLLVFVTTSINIDFDDVFCHFNGKKNHN